MVSMLFLIGEGKEPPSTAADLLDLQCYPHRPNYEMASELPLLLYDIGYEDVRWVSSPSSLADLASHWEERQIPHRLRSAMFHCMHRSLHSTLVPNPTANAAAIDEAQTDLGDVLTLNETFKQDTLAAAASTSQLAYQPRAAAISPNPPCADDGFVQWGHLAYHLLHTADGLPAVLPSSRLPGQPRAYVPMAKRPAWSGFDAASSQTAESRKRKAPA